MQWPERYTVCPKKQTKPKKQEDKIHIYCNSLMVSPGYMILYDTIQLYCHPAVIVITEIHFAVTWKLRYKK